MSSIILTTMKASLPFRTQMSQAKNIFYSEHKEKTSDTVKNNYKSKYEDIFLFG